MMQKNRRRIIGHRKSGSKHLQFHFGMYHMINRLVLVLPYSHVRCSEEHVFQHIFCRGVISSSDVSDFCDLAQMVASTSS
jgi:hypothetical protein